MPCPSTRARRLLPIYPNKHQSPSNWINHLLRLKFASLASSFMSFSLYHSISLHPVTYKRLKIYGSCLVLARTDSSCWVVLKRLSEWAKLDHFFIYICRSYSWEPNKNNQRFLYDKTELYPRDPHYCYLVTHLFELRSSRCENTPLTGLRFPYFPVAHNIAVSRHPITLSYMSRLWIYLLRDLNDQLKTHWMRHIYPMLQCKTPRQSEVVYEHNTQWKRWRTPPNQFRPNHKLTGRLTPTQISMI